MIGMLNIIDNDVIDQTVETIYINTNFSELKMKAVELSSRILNKLNFLCSTIVLCWALCKTMLLTRLVSSARFRQLLK